MLTAYKLGLSLSPELTLSTCLSLPLLSLHFEVLVTVFYVLNAVCKIQ